MHPRMAMTGFRFPLRTIHVRCYRMILARIRCASYPNYAWHKTILDQRNSLNVPCMRTDSTYMVGSIHRANSMDKDIGDSREMDILCSPNNTKDCRSSIHSTTDRSLRKQTASDSKNGIPVTFDDADSSRRRQRAGHPGRLYHCRDSLFLLRRLPAGCSIR